MSAGVLPAALPYNAWKLIEMLLSVSAPAEISTTGTAAAYA